MAPEVCVVIPTRNRLGMLKQALETVLNQRGVDLEVVVVDEGSSDETPAWLAGLTDPRVRVLRHDEPKRLPGARNAGARVATADLVAFLDDDDVWGRDKLRRQLDAMRAQGRSWSYVGCVQIDEDVRPVVVQRALAPEALPDAILRSNVVPGGGSGVVVSRAALEAAGWFDESLNAAEDWECWIRLVRQGLPAAVDEPLLGKRRLSNSMSHEIDRMLVASSRMKELHPDLVVPSADPDKPFGSPRALVRLAREAGDWRGAAKIVWLERHDRGTLLRAPYFLLTPLPVMRRLIYLRRSRIRWAKPLLRELAAYRVPVAA